MKEGHKKANKNAKNKIGDTVKQTRGCRGTATIRRLQVRFSPGSLRNDVSMNMYMSLSSIFFSSVNSNPKMFTSKMKVLIVYNRNKMVVARLQFNWLT